MTEPFFTRAAAEKMKPQVEKIADTLLSNIQQNGCRDGSVDLIPALAAPLNPKVILECIYNVPTSEADRLISSNTSLGGTSGSASEASGTDLHGFMSELVDKRIKSPGKAEDDLISKLVLNEYKTGSFSRDDIINLVYMIFVAGNTAITGSIALGVLTLLQHPKQLNDLKKDPSLAGNAVEETLRFHTPSALNSRRVAVSDTQLGGEVPFPTLRTKETNTNK